MKTNITRTEIESMLNYFNEHNLEVGTIELIENPIAKILKISKDFDSEQKDISDYSSF